MNWVKENKFVAGFLVVILAALGGMSFLLFNAFGAFSAVSEKYDQQTQELRRLQMLKPYPEASNLEKFKAERDAYLTAATDLQSGLAKMEFSLEAVTPEQFQDRLRDAVSLALKQAEEAQVKLPEKAEKFYLGFEQYQATPPRSEAAALLGRQLKAIEFLAGRLIALKAETLPIIKRAPLPEESLKDARSGPVSPKHSVSFSRVELTFKIEQSRFRRFLNEISSNSSQFFIVRSLVIKNEKDKGPSRGSDIPASVVDPANVLGTEGKKLGMEFVLGTEKLDVSMQIDIADFSEPAATDKK